MFSLSLATLILVVSTPLIDPPKPSFNAEVVGILDGDTIDVLYKKSVYRVRLAEIDAPEKKQPYGMASKEALAAMVFRKKLRVEWTKHEKWGRILGHVYLDGKPEVWVNLAMVKAGWAWQYTQYSKSKQLARVQREALRACRGLWKDAKPMPPWDFRKKRKQDKVREPW